MGFGFIKIAHQKSVSQSKSLKIRGSVKIHSQIDFFQLSERADLWHRHFIWQLKIYFSHLYPFGLVCETKTTSLFLILFINKKKNCICIIDSTWKYKYLYNDSNNIKKFIIIIIIIIFLFCFVFRSEHQRVQQVSRSCLHIRKQVNPIFFNQINPNYFLYNLENDGYFRD